MSRNNRWIVALACALLAIGAAPAQGQDKWPSRPVVYVVPFPPGGNTDTLARLINQKLGAALGQPVVIENKPGAGGNIGSDFVAKSKPDGYTILGGTISSHAINQSVYPSMPYDAVKSFEPVILLGSNPLVLAVNASTPYKTLKEVLDAAKSKPGQLAFASPGSGTSPHLAGELLKMLTHVDITHVPYKGSGPALSDVIGGQVPIIIDTTIVLGPQLKAGKLRPLAVAYPQRLSTLPDVPTAAEAGVPGWEVVSWQAVFAPAGTPKPIVQRLNAEIARIMKTPEVQARLADMGVEIGGGPPEQLGEFQKAEIAKWSKVVKAAGVKPE
ncbi:MAG TPA: tripartite tricarboxylate transporter substrate binding protein [Burkholderiales bacterium]|nr:tripartite tricarboxylate transporter substrate binding protein [Burkholderiales bacterium]